MSIEHRSWEYEIPAVSVIIPTHNRCDGLKRTLDALQRQDFNPMRFEVIVTADGCTDGTAEMVRTYPATYRLSCIEQSASGPAAARNVGAMTAASTLLLFLDDDIEASPTLISGHIEAHEKAHRDGNTFPVIIGYLPTILGNQQGLFRAALRGWWEDMFQTMARPGHRFAYTDLLSGNFSMSAEAFKHLGGFNTSLRCHEDYELGYRLIRSGAKFRFEREAMGLHHEKTDLDRSLVRKCDEGRADIALGLLYPELRPGLLLTRLWNNCAPGSAGSGLIMVLFSGCSRLVRHMALSRALWGDSAARGLRRILPALERMKLRRIWRWALDALMAYWYWRGVAEALPGRLAALERFLHDPAGPAAAAPLAVDVGQGLEAAETELERERPMAMDIYFNGNKLGSVSSLAGMEPLCGIHLRAALATTFVKVYDDFLSGSKLQPPHEEESTN